MQTMISRSSPTYYHAALPVQPPEASLEGDVRADVVILGGGFTGLSAALQAAESGASIVVLEAARMGGAASGRNGGQIHSGHRLSQAVLEKWLGRPHAHELWDLAEAGKARLRDLVARHGIDGDLKSGLVIAAHDQAALRNLKDEVAHLTTAYGARHLRLLGAQEIAALLGCSAGLYMGGLYDGSGGHVQPLALTMGLARAARAAGARLFEHSPALAIEQHDAGVVVRCAQGRVLARQAIVACDAQSGGILPELAPYIAQIESFIIATAPLSAAQQEMILPSDVAVADTRHVLDYYRKSKDGRLLFAGRERYFRQPKDIARLVRPRMAHVFPALRDIAIDYAWSGTVGITRTRMPHFGRLGPHILFGHGYSGHGVALSLIGGQVLAEAALGDERRFQSLARVPAQRFPGAAWLRKPLVSAGLLWFRLMDRF